MQGMGNVKANMFWEAELPSSYKHPMENDRHALESFIRSKYEARRWVPRSNRSPSRGGEDRHFSTERHRRSVDNGKERRHSEYGHEHEKDDTVDHDAAEVQDSRNSDHDLENENAETSRPSRSPFRHNAGPSTSHASQSPTRRAQESVRHVGVLPAPKPPQNPLNPVQAVPVPSVPKVEAPTDLFDLLKIDDPPQTGGATTSSTPPSDEQSWAAFQSAGPAPATESVISSGQVVSGSTESALPDSSSESSTKNDIIAGLEDLFTGSPAVLLKTPDAPQPPKDVKKDILSLFGQTSIASPYVAHQQQMAALLAQQRTMHMGATSASGVQIPSVFPGSQPPSSSQEGNSGTGNLGVMPTWSMAGSQLSGMPMPNSTGVQNGGLPFSQIGGPSHQLSRGAQIPIAASSFSTGLQGLSMPYQSIGSSLPSLSANAPNVYGHVSSAVKASTGAASEISTASTGANYDFSALTAAALMKH